jgi:hypothetical protein
MLMTETNTNSSINQHAPLKKEDQAAVVEREGIFCPLDLTEHKNEENENTEQKLTEILESMTVETSQLNEAINEESKIIGEVCLSLKEVLTKLHVSFNIPPEDVPIKNGTKKAVLDEDCRLTFVYGNDEKHTAFLAEYPPQMVMAVLWAVIPELAKAVTIYRKRMNARANFFEKIKKELKVAANSVASTSNVKSKPGEKPIEDIEKDRPKHSL